MTRMFNPPHPGEVLKNGVFADTSITVTEAAVSAPRTLGDILCEAAGTHPVLWGDV
ncbi:MAG: hypothetical protein ACREYC_14120 [Gammaproteobacteria bacterium]